MVDNGYRSVEKRGVRSAGEFVVPLLASYNLHRSRTRFMTRVYQTSYLFADVGGLHRSV